MRMRTEIIARFMSWERMLVSELLLILVTLSLADGFNMRERLAFSPPAISPRTVLMPLPGVAACPRSFSVGSPQTAVRCPLLGLKARMGSLRDVHEYYSLLGIPKTATMSEIKGMSYLALHLCCRGADPAAEARHGGHTKDYVPHSDIPQASPQVSPGRQQGRRCQGEAKAFPPHGWQRYVPAAT